VQVVLVPVGLLYTRKFGEAPLRGAILHRGQAGLVALAQPRVFKGSG
jgi:hypothetical protein